MKTKEDTSSTMESLVVVGFVLLLCAPVFKFALIIVCLLYNAITK